MGKMDELLSMVEALSTEECNRAIKKYGLFNNAHEAASVLREELEEAKDALGITEAAYNALWRMVKSDLPIDEQLKALKKFALETAAECVQIAAMCRKGTESIEWIQWKTDDTDDKNNI